MPAPVLAKRITAQTYQNPLHIRCGDDIRQTLKETGLPGPFLKWCDPVSTGPLAGANWYRARAEFLSGEDPSAIDEIENELREQDRQLETFRNHDAVILWFEHDLFDQAILMRLLDWFSTQDLTHIDLRIAGTDSFPGIERFIGIGQLHAPDLLSLYETSTLIGPSELRMGSEAWAAWTAPTPEKLARLAINNKLSLPYLQSAIQRQLEELPETESDLNTTERLTLEALGEQETTAGQLFVAVQNKERHPWRGDSMFYAELGRLAQAPLPLLEVSETPVNRGTKIQRTGQAQKILNAGTSWISQQGINRWVAGTHLTPQNLWRYHRSTQTLQSPR